MSVKNYTDYLEHLPSHWKRVELQTLGAIYSGGTPRRENPAFWQGTIPWVTPGELTNWDGKYITVTRDKITEAGLAGSGAHLLPKNALLVTTRATIGSVVLAGMAITTNQGFKSIVLEEFADPDFYYHYLKFITPELIRRASGSTFLEIAGSQFAKVVVPLPPLPEQRRIAAILDAADEAIRASERVLAKLRQVKAGLLHDLLTCGVDAQGRLRDPVAHPELFKASPLGRIPREWEVGLIGEIAETYAGGTPSRHTPGLFGGTIPWVKSSEINLIEIVTTEETLTEQGYQSSSVKWVPIDTPLIAMYGATAGAVSWLKIRAVTNQAVLATVPQSNIYARWLYWELVFRSPAILSGLQGSGQPNLSKKLIDASKAHLPPLTEQTRIAAILDAHDARLRAEEAAVAKLRQVKRGLMEDLLTGKVRV